MIDFAAERARLEKGLAAEQKEIFKIDAKLGNADFLRRAPEDVIEENQDRYRAKRRCLCRVPFRRKLA